jgi:GAF domain-containing protein
LSKAALYEELETLVRRLLAGERDPYANAANMSALLWQTLPDVSWVGFYFRKARSLVLGPFQGKPACSRLQVGRGVCGTAAEKAATLIVPDVHKFDGHVACDAASNSELVVPLVKYNTVIGVIDLDSQSFDRFDQDDAKGIESLAKFWVIASADIP